MGRPPSRPTGKKGKPYPVRAADELREIETLEAACLEQAPPSGSLAKDSSTTKFNELPISEKTKFGLNNGKFVDMTEIQRSAIPHALVGRDVLGAAKTGSGKTLAFIIPLLERLYRCRWGQQDGLGALVITPTRELALQIFDVLRVVGVAHTFSAGLVIGGKDVTEEKSRVCRMNIIISTPGRLLQHMDETQGFDASNLQILVLDEADRCLDLGFKECLDAILANVNRGSSRQTLLFSATQTKNVQDLARLSLKRDPPPEYVSVHEHSRHSTPAKLSQHYSFVRLPDKFNVLWSFIKTHIKQKTLVFFSTQKQVRFAYDAFAKLRPGVPLMLLYGRVKQMKRLRTYYDFCEKPSAVLFATDVAARGLDFTSVDWVVQVDCPEDPATYIHRCGRTARAGKVGNALLLLLESERPMLDKLEKAKIPLKKVDVNPDKVRPVTDSLRALMTEFPDLKLAAQKAVKAYLRSIVLAKDKDVFDMGRMMRGGDQPTKHSKGEGEEQGNEVANFARGLGLDGTIKVQSRGASHPGSSSKKKHESESEDEGRASSDDSDSNDDDNEKYDDDSNDDILVPKKSIQAHEQFDDGPSEAIDLGSSKRSLKRIRSDGAGGASTKNKKLVYDDEGRGMTLFERIVAEGQAKSDPRETALSKDAYVDQVRRRLKARADEDRALHKDRIREMHLKKKIKLRALEGGNEGEERMVVIGSPDRDSDDDDDDDHDKNNNDSDVGGTGSGSDSGEDDDRHDEGVASMRKQSPLMAGVESASEVAARILLERRRRR